MRFNRSDYPDAKVGDFVPVDAGIGVISRRVLAIEGEILIVSEQPEPAEDVTKE